MQDHKQELTQDTADTNKDSINKLINDHHNLQQDLNNKNDSLQH